MEYEDEVVYGQPIRGSNKKKKKKKMGGSSVAKGDESTLDVVNLDDSSLLDVVGGDSLSRLSNLTNEYDGDQADFQLNVLDDTSSNASKDLLNEIHQDDEDQVPNHEESSKGNQNHQDEEEGEGEDDLNELTSFHSQVTSPIGDKQQILKSTYLDVPGDESFRGSGTPPGSVVDSVHARSPETFPSSPSPLLSPTSPKPQAESPMRKNVVIHPRRASQDIEEGEEDYTQQLPDTPLIAVRQESGLSQQSSRSRRGLEDPAHKEFRRKLASARRKVWLYTMVSLVANFLLFSFKVYVSVASRSLAVMASAVDSFLDLVSQFIIYYALKGSREVDEKRYPVGRSRLEPIGIIVCASLMGIAALQLIYDGLETLFLGFFAGEDISTLVPNVDEYTLILLCSAIGTKFVLFLLCNSQRDQSDSMMVLAEDHRNDILSNSIALVTAYLSNAYHQVWYLDPIGGISIALYICVMWIGVAREQADMLEGVAAESSFLDEVKELGNTFHEKMYVDVVRAYHFGKRYLVEVEVVVPGTMIVVDAHDISIELQKKIERLESVERAFVHVDYRTREEDEHKVINFSTPVTTPPHVGDAMSDGELSRTSSLDLEEEVQITGDIYQKAVPVAYKKHVHVTHHRHHTNKPPSSQMLSRLGQHQHGHDHRDCSADSYSRTNSLSYLLEGQKHPHESHSLIAAQVGKTRGSKHHKSSNYGSVDQVAKF